MLTTIEGRIVTIPTEHPNPLRTILRLKIQWGKIHGKEEHSLVKEIVYSNPYQREELTTIAPKLIKDAEEWIKKDIGSIRMSMGLRHMIAHWMVDVDENEFLTGQNGTLRQAMSRKLQCEEV